VSSGRPSFFRAGRGTTFGTMRRLTAVATGSDGAVSQEPKTSQGPLDFHLSIGATLRLKPDYWRELCGPMADREQPRFEPLPMIDVISAKQPGMFSILRRA
jgi:hypothetical protein